MVIEQRQSGIFAIISFIAIATSIVSFHLGDRILHGDAFLHKVFKRNVVFVCQWGCDTSCVRLFLCHILLLHKDISEYRQGIVHNYAAKPDAGHKMSYPSGFPLAEGHLLAA